MIDAFREEISFLSKNSNLKFKNVKSNKKRSTNMKYFYWNFCFGDNFFELFQIIIIEMISEFGLLFVSIQTEFLSLYAIIANFIFNFEQKLRGPDTLTSYFRFFRIHPDRLERFVFCLNLSTVRKLPSHFYDATS